MDRLAAHPFLQRLEKHAQAIVCPIRARRYAEELDFFRAADLVPRLALAAELAGWLDRAGVGRPLFTAETAPSVILHSLGVGRADPFRFETGFWEHDWLRDGRCILPFTIAAREGDRVASVLRERYQAIIEYGADRNRLSVTLPVDNTNLFLRSGKAAGITAGLLSEERVGRFRFLLDPVTDMLHAILAIITDTRFPLTGDLGIPLESVRIDPVVVEDMAGLGRPWPEAVSRNLLLAPLDSLEGTAAIFALTARQPESAVLTDYLSSLAGKRIPPFSRGFPTVGFFEETHGIPVYQEQLCRAIASLSGIHPETIRESLCGDDDTDLETPFLAGAVSRGFDETEMEHLYAAFRTRARAVGSRRAALARVIPLLQLSWLRTHHGTAYRKARERLLP